MPVEPWPVTGLKGLDMSLSLLAFSASMLSMGSVMSSYYRSGQNAISGTDKECIQVNGRVNITEKESGTQICGGQEIKVKGLSESKGRDAGKGIAYGRQARSGDTEQNHIRSSECDSERHKKVGQGRTAPEHEAEETEQIGGKVKEGRMAERIGETM